MHTHSLIEGQRTEGCGVGEGGKNRTFISFGFQELEGQCAEDATHPFQRTSLIAQLPTI